MTDTPAATVVPFHLLVAVDAINARAKPGKDGLDELTRSIAEKGLIQPLAVRACRKQFDGSGVAKNAGSNGFYEIIDGRRRYAAMAKLVKSKAAGWDKRTEVPVLVRDEGDADALETSLVANTVRLPMHPVDQHEVFARLAIQGKAPSDIASRFGVAEKTVRQHMALGRLSPVVRAAWRQGKLDAKAAQAFTLHDDHEVQAAAYEKLAKQKHYNGVTDWAVRQELAVERAPVNCEEMRLVGVEAYLAAGGTLTESLFEDARYVDDMALLRKLAREVLGAKCSELLRDGWAWAEVDEDDIYRWSLESVCGDEGEPEPVFTAEEQARIDAIEAMPRPKPSDATAMAAALAASREAAEIETRAESRAWPADLKAKSGCYVSSDYYGSIEVRFGVLKPEDAPSQDGDENSDDDDVDAGSDGSSADADREADDEDDAGDDPFDISMALTTTLAETLTVAVALVLKSDPSIALRAITATLAARPWSSPLKLADGGHLEVRLPGGRSEDFADVFFRLAGKGDADLLSELALRVSGFLNLVTHSAGVHDGGAALRDALPGGSYLRAALELFNVADYFGRVSKRVMMAALEEMEASGVIRSLSADLSDTKKADLAAMAAEHARACGWLPPELRHPGYTLTPAAPAAGPEASAAKPKRGRKRATSEAVS